MKRINNGSTGSRSRRSSGKFTRFCGGRTQSRQSSDGCGAKNKRLDDNNLSSSYSGTVTIKAGEYTSTFTIETKDDDIEVMNTGKGTILCNVFGHEVINDLSCKYRRVA